MVQYATLANGKQKDTRPKKDTPKRPYNVSIRATPNLAHSPTSAVVSGGPTYMTKKSTGDACLESKRNKCRHWSGQSL